MGKGGKLTKLKSAIKRLHSMSKLGRTTNRSSSSIDAADGSFSEKDKRNYGDRVQPVYVGKSRRQYLISKDVMDHPLFQELVERSSSDGGGELIDGGGVTVACEVVLFEHLLWMLDNDGGDTQLGSMNELVEFYAY